MREQKVRHMQHQMTSSSQAHNDDNAILEPCWPLCQVRDVCSALVNRLYCTDVYCEWGSCPHEDNVQ